MGASLAKAAYKQFADLPHPALRVPVFMALTALDHDDPPNYNGGREHLVQAVADVSPGDDKALRNAGKAIDRVLPTLIEAGAISVIRRASPGHAAEYRLNLSIEHTPLDGERSDDSRRSNAPPHPGNVPTRAIDETHPAGRDNAPRWAGQRSPLGGTTLPAGRGAEE